MVGGVRKLGGGNEGEDKEIRISAAVLAVHGQTRLFGVGKLIFPLGT